MLNERKKQLQKEEVAVVKNIINIFSTNNLTYKQSVELLHSRTGFERIFLERKS